MRERKTPSGLEGKLIEITATGRIPFPEGSVIAFERDGRYPKVLYRSPLRKSSCKLVLYCWVPRDVCNISVRGGIGRSEALERVSCRYRQVSVLELLLRAAVRRPRKLLSVLNLLVRRNVKGASFRFARITDELNAPTYRQYLDVHTADVLSRPWSQPRQTAQILVTITSGAVEEINQTRQSLRRQTYRNWREVQEHDLRASGTESGDALWMRIPSGTILSDTALEEMALPLATESIGAVYSDEDRIAAGRRTRFDPIFKPAWDPLLAETRWLTLEPALVRLSAVPGSIDLPASSTSEILLQISKTGTSRIAHVPRVLAHRKQPIPHPSVRKPKVEGNRRFDVSIIIPTRDRVDLLKTCIEGLLTKTAGVKTEIIVIDNESQERETHAYLDQIQSAGIARVLKSPGSFNFAALSNCGVGAATLETILLLNNDVEPIESDWLMQMCQELDCPDVGIVGACLLFPDGFVQHGGVILGAGSVARHSFHFLHPRSAQSKGLLSQRRRASAVTAACLLTRKSLWEDVGGMDEDNLAVAFNDVDYCLKVRERGKAIVWTPFARLWHHESVSRGPDDTAAKRWRFAKEEEFMHHRWAAAIANDPCYNPNLSLVCEEFVLERNTRSLSWRTNELPRSLDTVGEV